MIIRAENIRKYFAVRRDIRDFFKPLFIRAVDGVSIEVNEGEFFGLVGESGCGKTTFGKILVGLIRPTSGRVFFKGIDITNKRLKGELRRKIQMIFQNPFSSLNPHMRVRDIVLEGVKIHKLFGGRDMDDTLERVLRDVGLSIDIAESYPDELSGGQRQRVAIARALAVQPEFLVADEPTSSLDVSVRAQILELLDEIRERFKMGILFISHDINTIKAYAHRVAVMYLGEIVEEGKAEEVFSQPLHPYTKLLLDSVPDLHRVIGEGRYTLRGIEGEPPSPINPPPACRFAPRCPFKKDICEEEKPYYVKIRSRRVMCHFAGKI